MSECAFPDSAVFTDPASIALVTPIDPGAIDATSAPIRLGGENITYATIATAAGQTQRIVLDGDSNRLNLNVGAAEINVTGGGGILESVALVDDKGNVIQDETKYIKLTADDPALPYNGSTVDTGALVSGNSYGSDLTIAEAAGGQIPEGGFSFYATGGSGDDNFRGSNLADFIRGGDGDDCIDAGDGNDLVRGGSGSDRIHLGTGQDTLYYTLDQIDNALDVITDFRSGEDKISLANGISYQIVDDGATIIFSGPGGITSSLTSTGGDLFDDDDVVFLG